MNECNTISVLAGQTVGLMARAKHPTTNSYISQAAVFSIRVDVYGTDDDLRTYFDAIGNIITNGLPYAIPSKTAVIFDTLQADSRWTSSPHGDSTGYNVLYGFTPLSMDTNYVIRMTMIMIDGTSNVLEWTVESR